MSTKDNKEIVLAFYEQAFNDGEPEQAAAAHLGATYTQHNPGAPDGAEGFIARWRTSCPTRSVQDVRRRVERFGVGSVANIASRRTHCSSVRTARAIRKPSHIEDQYLAGCSGSDQLDPSSESASRPRDGGPACGPMLIADLSGT